MREKLVSFVFSSQHAMTLMQKRKPVKMEEYALKMKMDPWPALALTVTMETTAKLILTVSGGLIRKIKLQCSSSNPERVKG